MRQLEQELSASVHVPFETRLLAMWIAAGCPQGRAALDLVVRAHELFSEEEKLGNFIEPDLKLSKPNRFAH
jgi:hypothetical protein